MNNTVRAKFKVTPSGRMEMQIDNPVAIERMPVGKTFYVDFTPVD